MLVKHAPFFAIDSHKQSITVNLTDQSSEQSDDEKEAKNLETVDDDFIHRAAISVAQTLLSKKISDNFIAPIVKLVISLPDTPPEDLS